MINFKKPLQTKEIHPRKVEVLGDNGGVAAVKIGTMAATPLFYIADIHGRLFDNSRENTLAIENVPVMALVFRPTGEVRIPQRGEWYMYKQSILLMETLPSAFCADFEIYAAVQEVVK